MGAGSVEWEEWQVVENTWDFWDVGLALWDLHLGLYSQGALGVPAGAGRNGKARGGGGLCSLEEECRRITSTHRSPGVPEARGVSLVLYPKEKDLERSAV
jgi:hypothetical protein